MRIRIKRDRFIDLNLVNTGNLGSLCSTWGEPIQWLSFFQEEVIQRGRKREKALATAHCSQSSGVLARITSSISSLPSSLPQYCPPSSLSDSFLMSSSVLLEKRCVVGVMEFPEDNNKALLITSTWLSLIEHCQNRFLTKESVHFMCYCHGQKRKEIVSSTICPWPFSHLWSQWDITLLWISVTEDGYKYHAVFIKTALPISHFQIPLQGRF